MDRARLAHHEAGHACAAVALGQNVLRVTIEPDAETYGRCQLEPLTVDADVIPLVLLAGYQAERLYERSAGLDATACCGADDFELLADLLCKKYRRLVKHRHDPQRFLADPDVAALAQRASSIVQRAGGVIEDLASRLLVTGSVEADELRDYTSHVQPDLIYAGQREAASAKKLAAAREQHAKRQRGAVDGTDAQRVVTPKRPQGSRWIGTHVDRAAMLERLKFSPNRFGPCGLANLRAELTTLERSLPTLEAAVVATPQPVAEAVAPAAQPEKIVVIQQPAEPDTEPRHIIVDEIQRISDRPTRCVITHDDGTKSYIQFE